MSTEASTVFDRAFYEMGREFFNALNPAVLDRHPYAHEVIFEYSMRGGTLNIDESSISIREGNTLYCIDAPAVKGATFGFRDIAQALAAKAGLPADDFGFTGRIAFDLVDSKILHTPLQRIVVEREIAPVEATILSLASNLIWKNLVTHDEMHDLQREMEGKTLRFEVELRKGIATRKSFTVNGEAAGDSAALSMMISEINPFALSPSYLNCSMKGELDFPSGKARVAASVKELADKRLPTSVIDMSESPTVELSFANAGCEELASLTREIRTAMNANPTDEIRLSPGSTPGGLWASSSSSESPTHLTTPPPRMSAALNGIHALAGFAQTLSRSPVPVHFEITLSPGAASGERICCEYSRSPIAYDESARQKTSLPQILKAGGITESAIQVLKDNAELSRIGCVYQSDSGVIGWDGIEPAAPTSLHEGIDRAFAKIAQAVAPDMPSPGRVDCSFDLDTGDAEFVTFRIAEAFERRVTLVIPGLSQREVPALKA